MTAATMLVPTILFWVLVAIFLCVPPRYAVLIFILIAQLDLTGVAFYSDVSLGWENTLKVIVIPAILLLRVRPIDLLPTAFRFARNAWVCLVAYAALAIAWSPYRLSGVKLIGYFYSYSVLFVVFCCAWRRHWITRGWLIGLVSVSLCFAGFQTYVLGNAYGDPEYGNRFTTFADAQSFAPFLICLIILLVICNRRTVGSLMVAIAAVFGLVLTGSRSSLIGFAWVALIIGIALAKQANRQLRLSILVRNIAIGCLIFAFLGLLVLNELPQSRMNELVEIVTSYDNHSLESVETFAWRLTVYAEAVKDLSNRGWRGLAIGSGTSSGALVGLQTGYFTEANVDPNRVIHDEFLRSLYEWGIVGLLTFLFFLAALLRLCLRIIKLTSSPYAWACIAAFGPLVIGLLIENIFADGASPGGVAYCLLFASLVAQLRPAIAKAKASASQPVNLLPQEAQG